MDVIGVTIEPIPEQQVESIHDAIAALQEPQQPFEPSETPAAGDPPRWEGGKFLIGEGGYTGLACVVG